MSKEANACFRVPKTLPGEYRRWEAPEFSGWIDAALYEDLDPDQRSDPGALLRLPDVNVIRDGRNLTARISIAGRPLWIKRFRPVHALDRLVYAARPGKAAYAWNAAMALLEQGFCTPRPLIGLRRVGRWGGSEGIAAFEELEGHASVRDLLAGGTLGPAERDRMLGALGDCLRRFHDLGFRHRDLRRGNILAAAAGGGWRFCLLDLNRLRVQAPLTEIQRVREVEKLNLPRDCLEPFLRRYMPDRDSARMAEMIEVRVDYADRLERLPLGRLLRKAWYYSWELRAFGRARRP